MGDWLPFIVFWSVLLLLPIPVTILQLKGVSSKRRWIRKNWVGLVIVTVGLGIAWYLIYAAVMIMSTPI